MRSYRPLDQWLHVKYECMLHSQNLDHNNDIFLLDDWKEVYNTRLLIRNPLIWNSLKPQNSPSDSVTAEKTPIIPCDVPRTQCFRHSLVSPFSGDGGWQFAGWGFLWSKQRHRPPQQNSIKFNFLDIRWEFCLIEIYPKKVRKSKINFLCVFRREVCSLQWKCLD